VSSGLGWQYAVIGVVVAASCVVMVRKLAPAWASRRQTALAARLGGQRNPVLRWLGQRLAPAAAAGGCDSGCSTCGGCGTPDGPPPEESPLTFKPRAARDHADAAGAPHTDSHTDSHTDTHCH